MTSPEVTQSRWNNVDTPEMIEKCQESQQVLPFGHGDEQYRGHRKYSRRVEIGAVPGVYEVLCVSQVERARRQREEVLSNVRSGRAVHPLSLAVSRSVTHSL